MDDLSQFKKILLSGIETAPHSHNLYLQIFVESGIFVLLLFLILLIVYARYCFTRLSSPMERNDRLLLAGLFCGIIAVLAQGMTDYIWYNYRVFLMFWIVIGLTAALGRMIRREPKEAEDPYSFESYPESSHE